MLDTFVVRLVPRARSQGQIAGEVVHVSAGREVVFTTADELIEALLALQADEA